MIIFCIDGSIHSVVAVQLRQFSDLDIKLSPKKGESQKDTCEIEIVYDTHEIMAILRVAGFFMDGGYAVSTKCEKLDSYQ